MSLCTKVEGLGGKGRSRSSAPSPRADCPPPVAHGGTEGRVGQDYVSSELALPCARLGMDTPPGDAGATASGAPGGRCVGGGCRTGSPMVNSVAWRRGPGRPGPCARRAARAALCAALCVVLCAALCAALCAVLCAALCAALALCAVLCAASCGALCAASAVLCVKTTKKGAKTCFT